MFKNILLHAQLGKERLLDRSSGKCGFIQQASLLRGPELSPGNVALELVADLLSQGRENAL
jgi:hypothetical protein